MALTETPTARTSFRAAFRSERATKTRAPRTPALVVAGRLAARLLPRWQAVRTAILAISGFAAITYGAWQITDWLGYIVGGLSLLVLEALSGDRQ